MREHENIEQASTMRVARAATAARLAGAATIVAIGLAASPASASSVAANAPEGVDANQLLKAPFQTAALAVLGLTFLLVGMRVVSLRRRTLWARRHAHAKGFNPLARTSTRMVPAPAPALAGPTDVPGWLVTGSIDAPRRAWGPSTPASLPAPVVTPAMASAGRRVAAHTVL